MEKTVQNQSWVAAQFAGTKLVREGSLIYLESAPDDGRRNTRMPIRHGRGYNFQLRRTKETNFPTKLL